MWHNPFCGIQFWNCLEILIPPPQKNNLGKFARMIVSSCMHEYNLIALHLVLSKIYSLSDYCNIGHFQLGVWETCTLTHALHICCQKATGADRGKVWGTAPWLVENTHWGLKSYKKGWFFNFLYFTEGDWLLKHAEKCNPACSIGKRAECQVLGCVCVWGGSSIYEYTETILTKWKSQWLFFH